MNTGDYALARGHLERVLGLRPGARFPRDGDVWRARTYGMHFEEGDEEVAGYFPNRELGVCLFRLGDLAAAERQLVKSLGQTPSARARYYLNQVRARGADPAAPPPTVTLDAASAVLRTSARERELRATAESGARISEIEIAGEPEFVDLAEPRVAFRRTLPLRAGTNTFAITTRDLAGHSTARTVTWIADWRAPVIGIQRLERAGGGWHLEADCSDDGPLRRVAVGGHVFYQQAPGESRSAVTFSGELPDGPLLFEAEDEAGNALRLPFDPSICRAALGGRALQVAATATAGLGGTPEDTFPPEILLNVGTHLQVINNEIWILGDVEDIGGGLAQVALEGARNAQPPAAFDHSRIALFAFRAELAVGTNHLRVVAVDAAGNRSSRDLEIVRLDLLQFDDTVRLALALPPVDSGGAGEYARDVHRLLSRELLREAMRFQYVSRDEAAWHSILHENEISLTELANPNAALKAGELVTADLLLVVQAFKRDKGHELVAQAVETTAGKVVCQLDVNDPGDEAALAYEARRLITRLKQGFPLVECKVVEAHGDSAVVDFGRDRGVPVGARFVAIADEQGTAPRVVNDQWVEVSVTSVGETTSKIKALPKRKMELRPGDRLFTR